MKDVENDMELAVLGREIVDAQGDGCVSDGEVGDLLLVAGRAVSEPAAPAVNTAVPMVMPVGRFGSVGFGSSVTVTADG